MCVCDIVPKMCVVDIFVAAPCERDQFQFFWVNFTNILWFQLRQFPCANKKFNLYFKHKKSFVRKFCMKKLCLKCWWNWPFADCFVFVILLWKSRVAQTLWRATAKSSDGPNTIPKFVVKWQFESSAFFQLCDLFEHNKFTHFTMILRNAQIWALAGLN